MSLSLTSPMNLTDANRLGLPDFAFVGRAGAGKTTAAQLLVTTLRYEPMSFAHPIKKIAKRLWGPEGAADRDKLQQLGMACRQIDKDVWVNLLLEDLQYNRLLIREYYPVAVDDCRFMNEWYALKAAGFVMVRVTTTRTRQVDRLKTNGKWQNFEQLDHVSETELDHLTPEHTIVNNGTMTDFHNDIITVLDRERRRR